MRLFVYELIRCSTGQVDGCARCKVLCKFDKTACFILQLLSKHVYVDVELIEVTCKEHGASFPHVCLNCFHLLFLLWRSFTVHIYLGGYSPLSLSYFFHMQEPICKCRQQAVSESWLFFLLPSATHPLQIKEWKLTLRTEHASVTPHIHIHTVVTTCTIL